MTEIKTSNMLIRAIPLDVWERVDRLCRRKGFKRREYIEHALSFFEEGEAHLETIKETEKIRSAEEKIYEMAEIIKLKKKISNIRKDINCIDDRKTEMNMILELNKAEEEVNQSIKENIPTYEIPEEEEARRKMGLPEEYCKKQRYERIAIPEGFDRGFDRGFEQTPVKSFNEIDSFLSEAPFIQEMIRKVEELKLKRESEEFKEKQEADQKVDTTSQENGVDEEPVKTSNDSEVKMKYVDSSENPQSSEEKKKEIKTTVFGRGFEGLDDE